MNDVKMLSDDSLKNLIKNHQDKRDGSASSIVRRSKSCIADTGRSRSRYVNRLPQSCRVERRIRKLWRAAEANGAVWGKVRYPMNSHLWALVRHAHSKGWPMLSAMVVNKQNTATG